MHTCARHWDPPKITHQIAWLYSNSMTSFYIRIISKLQCKRNLLTCWFWSLVLTRSRGNTHETPIIPAIPPFTILGTMENDFCWGLLDTSLTSVLPDIVTDETLSVAAAAEIPVDIDGIKWQFWNVPHLF